MNDLPVVANDEILPARELFAGIPAAWSDLPAELIVGFDLTENGGIQEEMFRQYRRSSLAEALEALLTEHMYFVMLRYTIVARGVLPLLEWDVDAPLSRVGSVKPRKREKVQGVHPWDWQGDPSLVELYQYSPPVGFFCCPRPTDQPSIRLRVGGRSQDEAMAHWTYCAASLRKQRRAVRGRIASGELSVKD